jgi:hypothetical protein
MIQVAQQIGTTPFAPVVRENATSRDDHHGHAHSRTQQR